MPTDHDPTLVEALNRAGEDLKVGMPLYRGRVRSARARRAAVAAAALGLAGVATAGLLSVDSDNSTNVATAPSASGDPASDPSELVLNVTPTTGAFRPGETIRVSGAGCPPKGTTPVQGDPVGVTLSPSGGGPGWSVSDGSVRIVNFLAYVPGLVTAGADPTSDGTWAVDIAVPADSPDSDDYRISVLCATRLAVDQSGFAVEPGSLEAATVTSGPIAIDS